MLTQRLRDQVTFCIKTIHRPQCCAALVRSIHRHHDDPPLIHVLDDGQPELRFSTNCPDEAAMVDIGPIFTPQITANLLAVYPNLTVTGEWSNEPFRLDRRMLSHAETASSHLVLTRFLLRLGVNARRFRLRITEDADASTLQPAGT